MTIILLLLACTVFCFNLTMIYRTLRLRKIHKKKKNIRKAIVEMSVVVFEMEIALKDGALHNCPNISKQFEQFIRFYNSFSVCDLTDNDLKGLGVKWSSIISILKGDEQIEAEIKAVQEEILTISNKRTLELYVNQLYFMNFLMYVSTPVKYNISDLALCVKKNIAVRNFGNFELFSLKMSKNKKTKIEIANYSGLINAVKATNY